MLLISKFKITKLERILSLKFEMKDLGNAKKMLGIVIERDRTKNKCNNQLIYSS